MVLKKMNGVKRKLLGDPQGLPHLLEDAVYKFWEIHKISLLKALCHIVSTRFLLNKPLC